MLKVENISAWYGKKQVLFDISLEVKEGEIVLLTGGNGSGKSTLLRTIYGLVEKWTGKVFFNGEDISKCNTSELIKKRLVYIPQKNNYFENLTVQENLQVSGSTYSSAVKSERIEDVYKNITYLKNFETRTPFSLSGGERQLVALGNALMHKPKMIFFDEPFAGLDEANSKIMVDELLKLKRHNISILIIEHKKMLTALVDKVLIMSLGKLT